MTSNIFRINYDDKEKLVPILKKFGDRSFTTHTVAEKCDGLKIKSGDILRWRMNEYIIKTDDAIIHGKYNYKVGMWRLSGRVIKRLNQKPDTRKR